MSPWKRVGSISEEWVLNFRIIQAQAVLFTSAVNYRGSKFLSHFMSKWDDLFTGEPVSLEPPENLPHSLAGTFPRAILKSEDSLIRLQVTTQRLDFFSRVGDESSVDLQEHFQRATDLFIAYKEHMPAEVNRVASIVMRAALDECPARTISRRFCREEWLAGPINRPEEFELHALKTYRLADAFDLNSWFRCKSGTIIKEQSEKEQSEKDERRVIMVEQDLNTRGGGVLLNTDEVRHYFSLAREELEGIFRLYFGSDAG